MSLMLGSTAPNFTQQSTHGTITLYDHLGESWGMLFSHPLDFTPVCTTELGQLAELHDEFTSRGVKVLALSVDNVASHNAWIEDINALHSKPVRYPILADVDRSVATLYRMIHPDLDSAVTVRTVYIIDPSKKIRLTLTYPPSAGRNFDELLRVVDSLQLTDQGPFATPANWQPGQRVVLSPKISDDEARAQHAEIDFARPYLRYVAGQ